MKINIAIGFLQNFGLAVLIDVDWPNNFKDIFGWFELFSLNFTIFGGEDLGEWVGIWMGLLLPPFLLWNVVVFKYLKKIYRKSCVKIGQAIYRKIVQMILACMAVMAPFQGLSFPSEENTELEDTNVTATTNTTKGSTEVEDTRHNDVVIAHYIVLSGQLQMSRPWRGCLLEPPPSTPT